MNIMELKIGETGVGPDGARFKVIRDEVDWRPMLGRVTIRFTTDQHGATHKFIRGIEIERAPILTETALPPNP